MQCNRETAMQGTALHCTALHCTALTQWSKESASQYSHPDSSLQQCTQSAQHSTLHKKFIYMQGAHWREGMSGMTGRRGGGGGGVQRRAVHLQVCGCAWKVIRGEVHAGQVEDSIQDAVLVHWAARQHAPHCHQLFLYINKMPA